LKAFPEVPESLNVQKNLGGILLVLMILKKIAKE